MSDVNLKIFKEDCTKLNGKTYFHCESGGKYFPVLLNYSENGFESLAESIFVEAYNRPEIIRDRIKKVSITTSNEKEKRQMRYIPATKQEMLSLKKSLDSLIQKNKLNIQFQLD